jgi:hypothetical protein
MCQRERKEDMTTFRTTLIASLGAFSVGVTCAVAAVRLDTKAVNPGCVFKSGKARMSDGGFLPAEGVRAPCDLYTPAGYSPLGIAKINGRRIGVYAVDNGAKLGDPAGWGRGYADVFDSAGHLIRRFLFRENLNSPPQIIEFVYFPSMPAPSAKSKFCFERTAPGPRRTQSARAAR